MESESGGDSSNPPEIIRPQVSKSDTDKQEEMEEVITSGKNRDGLHNRLKHTSFVVRSGRKNVVEPPTSGMIFNSADELFEYYKNYGKQKGFALLKKQRKKDDQGRVSFVIFACSLSGKSRSKEEKKIPAVVTLKTQCRARVCATVFDDGKARVSSVILEHNHELCPNEVRYLKRRTILLGSHAKTQHFKAAVVSCGSDQKAASCYKELEHEIEENCLSNDTSDDKNRRYKHSSDVRFGGPDVIKPPFPGMMFDSANELFGYYKLYGNQNGFPILRKSNKKDDQGRLKFVVFACSLSGKPRCKEEKLIYPSPTTKTQCKAKVSATVFDDGKVRVFSVILDHNHELRATNIKSFKDEDTASACASFQLVQNNQADTRRFGEICKELFEIARMGSVSEEKTQVVLSFLSKLKEKLSIKHAGIGSHDAVVQINTGSHAEYAIRNSEVVQQTKGLSSYADCRNHKYNESFVVMSDPTAVIDGPIDSRREVYEPQKHKESNIRRIVRRTRKRKQHQEDRCLEELDSSAQVLYENVLERNGTSLSYQFSQGICPWLPQYYVAGACQNMVFKPSNRLPMRFYQSTLEIKSCTLVTLV